MTTNAQRLAAHTAKLPSVAEIVAVALAGQARRHWYRDSRAAMLATFGPDASRFAALLAAMSPQVSVATNFHNALHTLINWHKGGRKLHSDVIRGIMGRSVMGANGRASVLPAWVPNAVRALVNPYQQLSGPKVNAFRCNLQGHTQLVTLDAWMARFAGIKASSLGVGRSFGRSLLYDAYSDQIRLAAWSLGWQPAEVQAAVWCWTSAAWKYGQSVKGLATIAGCVADGDITAKLVADVGAFDAQFHDADHAMAINASGLGALRSALDVPDTVTLHAAADPSMLPHLVNAARRLDAQLIRSTES